MSVTHSSRERGDTLIEVLLAITVLAIVLVGTFALMNRGMAQMYSDMEQSQVRLLLDRQSELLIYARDQYLRQAQGDILTDPSDIAAVIVWQRVQSQVPASKVPDINECNFIEGAFTIQPTGAGDARPRLVAGAILGGVGTGFPAPGNGITIQKRDNMSASVHFRDFYIRACWRQNTSPVTQALSSVVRLYD